MSHGEPGVITVGGIQTLMLDLIFLKEECFKASEEIIGALKKIKAIMVLVTFQ